MSEVDVSDPDFLELMVARFTPRPQTEECRIRTVRELDERLANFLAEPMLVIGLTCLGEDADWGSFFLFLNGDRAWVHLTEGSCFTARDPIVVESSPAPVMFQDDAGFSHEVPFENNISRTQGLQALRHWLPRGEKLPELTWVIAAR